MLRGAEPLFRPSVYIPSSRIIAWLQQHEWKIERGVRRSRVKNSIGRKIRDDSVSGVSLRGSRDPRFAASSRGSFSSEEKNRFCLPPSGARGSWWLNVAAENWDIRSGIYVCRIEEATMEEERRKEKRGKSPFSIFRKYSQGTRLCVSCRCRFITAIRGAVISAQRKYLPLRNFLPDATKRNESKLKIRFRRFG